MKKYFLLLAISLWLAGTCPSTLHAGEKQRLSQKTYKTLIAARETLAAGNATKAVSNLQTLLATLPEKPYEQAVVLQSIAHAHISQEEYRLAIPPLRESLDLDVLPSEPQQQSRYSLIRLYMATEDFSKAIDLLKLWFAQAEPPRLEAYVILATAYLQLEHYQEAIEPLRKAIEMSQEPRENLHQSLLGIYSELQQYDQCVALLHTMLKLFPNRPAYWHQLVGIQLTREKNHDALAVMELAHLRGHLMKEQELINLVQLYMYLDVPHKAAALMQKEMDQGRINKTPENLEHLANAWLAAREMDRSIAAMEQAVAADTKNIKLSLRLAQLYVENELWEEAAEQLQQTLKGKHLKDNAAGQAWLLLGIARIQTDKNKNDAALAFNEAAKFNTTREKATQWLTYLQNGQ